MIRRIELVNFMSHARTVIEPAEGLTVLVGPNNCGKSAVVAALQILCHNETSTYVMRHGEKDCSVTVETDDGHTITWRRRKSPAYFLNGAELSRLERSEVPEEILKALRLPMVGTDGSHAFDVHFGEQKSPVFLLDKPGSQAAQFFASSSDAASLVEMQKRHQQKMSEARREHARLEGEAERLARDLSILSKADSVGTLLEDAESQHSALRQLSSDISWMNTLLHSLNAAALQRRRLSSESEALGPLTPPPPIQPTGSISQAVTQLTRAHSALAHHSATADALIGLHPTPTQTDEAALDHLIADLATAEHDSLRTEAEHEAILPLRPPPPQDDVTGLKALVRELESGNQRLTRLEMRANTLNTLMIPPSLADEPSLARLIAMLNRDQSAVARADGICRQLETLAAPEPPGNTSEITRLLSSLRQADALVDKFDREAASAVRDLGEAESALRRWAESNQVCPTCGGRVDPNLLTAHARAHHGGDHA